MLLKNFCAYFLFFTFFIFFLFFLFDIGSLIVECLGHYKHQVIVTSFGCSHVDGRGAAQSPNCWRSCKIQGKMGKGRMDDMGMVMDMECMWNLGGMGMLSCMQWVLECWFVSCCSW